MLRQRNRNNASKTLRSPLVGRRALVILRSFPKSTEDGMRSSNTMYDDLPANIAGRSSDYASDKVEKCLTSITPVERDYCVMASSVSKSRITAIRKTTKTTGMQFTLRRRGMVIPLESLRGLRYKGASSWSPHTLRAAGTEERPRRNAGRRCGNNEAQRRGKSASGFFFFFR